jgi:chromosome segregation ATPase
MNKMNTLQTKLTDIQNTISELETLIQEKSESIHLIETQMATLEENYRAEKSQVDEFTKKLQGYQELMHETESYYKQIEQNIETLMNILTTSPS